MHHGLSQEKSAARDSLVNRERPLIRLSIVETYHSLDYSTSGHDSLSNCCECEGNIIHMFMHSLLILIHHPLFNAINSPVTAHGIN